MIERVERLQQRARRAVGVILRPTVILRRLRYGPIYYRALRYTNLWREVRELKPRRIVEVGVWRGLTASRLIEEALKAQGEVDYWGFDLFAEGMTLDVLARESAIQPLSRDEVLTRVARPGATIHLVEGDTKITLAQTDLPPADLVFIDGGHSYETVASDWSNIQRILHPNSVVYFDDYTNEVGEQRGYGVRRLVDSIDRSRWEVQLLEPADRYKMPEGIQETRFARIRRRPA
jgi:predicted O-methyltransferase YrrM